MDANPSRGRWDEVVSVQVSAGDDYISSRASTASSGLVGSAQELIEGLSALACGATHPNSQAEASLCRLEDHLLDRLTKTLSDGVCILLDCEREERNESVRPLTGCDIIPAETALDLGVYCREHGITAVSAQCIIDLAEAIDIDEQHADRIPIFDPVVGHRETPHVRAARDGITESSLPQTAQLALLVRDSLTQTLLSGLTLVGGLGVLDDSEVERCHGGLLTVDQEYGLTRPVH